MELRPPETRAGVFHSGAGCDSGAYQMTGAFKKRIAKLEARRQGDQIPVFCEEESEVPDTIDLMIAAGELTEADRVLCVYWLDCVGPNAVTDAELRSFLAQCDAEEKQAEPDGASAPDSGRAD
ncbi:MAG: hypothetical protein QOK01_3559 [Alphaproteobacteria bacterium]|nr:hypothetical protein [Alphaproteobacteria bacterium]